MKKATELLAGLAPISPKSLTTIEEGQHQSQADRLAAPFDPEDISWKPQTVDYKNNTALGVAYADPRAYVDRFNDVFGVGRWTDEYEFVVTPFTKVIKAKKAYKDTLATEERLVPGNKVLCIATIMIHDYDVVISSTGDSDASDDNAATSAEAQAFKRAAMKLGTGRYLYELPKLTKPYSYGKWTDGPPTLPDWALPATFCDDCEKKVTAATHGDRTFSISALLKNSQTKYQKNICADCQRARTEASKTEASKDRIAATV